MLDVCHSIKKCPYRAIGWYPVEIQPNYHHICAVPRVHILGTNPVHTTKVSVLVTNKVTCLIARLVFNGSTPESDRTQQNWTIGMTTDQRSSQVLASFSRQQLSGWYSCSP